MIIRMLRGRLKVAPRVLPVVRVRAVAREKSGWELMVEGLVRKAAQTIEKALKTAIDQRYPGHRYVSLLQKGV
jgi:hypothetical protein